uniref:C2H2-type domain-containing protein n=1 Tax=Anopheles culicifacies TaxID=139723 RepID=A0A182MTX9_9DIPT
MSGFRLEHFPKVCHICLQHHPEDLLISLNTIDHSHGVQLIDVVNEFMIPISPELQHLTPCGICEACLKELNTFRAYRNRLKLIGNFVFSLALLQHGQTDHLEKLLREHHSELIMVLRELKITDKHELVVQDLLDEFNRHCIGSKVEQPSQLDDTCIENSSVLKENEEFVEQSEYLEQEGNINHTPETNDVELHPDGEFVAIETDATMREFCNESEETGEERNGHICKRCNHAFDTKRELMQHKRSTHRDHMCDTCGLAFDTKFVLENHRKRHETLRQYKCEYCPLEYYTKAEKLLHVRRLHLNAFEVSCPECALMFRTKQTLAQHMKTHTNQRTHTCNTCGFSFKSHTHLNRHTKELHQGVQFQCEHCDTTYRRKDKLRMHVEKMHNIQTYFVCDICLQSYDTHDKLQEHKAHHQNPNDLQCGVCLGAYVTNEEFSNHLCITYRENYICCNRDFKYHYFYNKHMFLVHGEQTNVRVKPLDGVLLGQYRAKRKQAERCPKCEQEFGTRQQKKNHMKTCGLVEEEYDNTMNVAVHEEELFLTMNTVAYEVCVKIFLRIRRTSDEQHITDRFERNAQLYTVFFTGFVNKFGTFRRQQQRGTILEMEGTRSGASFNRLPDKPSIEHSSSSSLGTFSAKLSFNRDRSSWPMKSSDMMELFDGLRQRVAMLLPSEPPLVPSHALGQCFFGWLPLAPMTGLDLR